jgi:hypothetical protein
MRREARIRWWAGGPSVAGLVSGNQTARQVAQQGADIPARCPARPFAAFAIASHRGRQELIAGHIRQVRAPDALLFLRWFATMAIARQRGGQQ